MQEESNYAFIYLRDDMRRLKIGRTCNDEIRSKKYLTENPDSRLLHSFKCENESDSKRLEKLLISKLAQWPSDTKSREWRRRSEEVIYAYIEFVEEHGLIKKREWDQNKQELLRHADDLKQTQLQNRNQWLSTLEVRPEDLQNKNAVLRKKCEEYQKTITLNEITIHKFEERNETLRNQLLSETTRRESVEKAAALIRSQYSVLQDENQNAFKKVRNLEGSRERLLQEVKILRQNLDDTSVKRLKKLERILEKQRLRNTALGTENKRLSALVSHLERPSLLTQLRTAGNRLCDFIGLKTVRWAQSFAGAFEGSLAMLSFILCVAASLIAITFLLD